MAKGLGEAKGKDRQKSSGRGMDNGLTIWSKGRARIEKKSCGRERGIVWTKGLGEGRVMMDRSLVIGKGLIWTKGS